MFFHNGEKYDGREKEDRRIRRWVREGGDGIERKIVFFFERGKGNKNRQWLCDARGEMSSKKSLVADE